ncbi:hypothetical protein RHGRI_015781 [Rhododendron griersonianum]|uniref:Uncharacterized protein n=1 Tax=Rhododendron griersonianum TaxID=479676 RepID=A0AAV6JSZ2_9ERIC|nr:hypothetical protein RHGRI_015781 [Rhododendron griersonianum]
MIPYSRAISVGSFDPLLHHEDISTLILPAIHNVHMALRSFGVSHVAVSTTLSFLDIITIPFLHRVSNGCCRHPHPSPPSIFK